MLSRIGIIGLGNIGTLHKKIYKKLGVKKIQRYDPARGYYDRMDNCDGISLCVPNDMKESYLHAFRDKPILCEKPIPVDAGSNVFPGYVYRFRKGINKFKGKLCLDLVFYRKRAVFYAPWQHDKKRCGGGALLDIGSHLIDLGLYLQGFPKVFKTHALLTEYLGGLEHNAYVELKTSVGKITVHVLWSGATREGFWINGKEYPMWVEEEAFERELKAFLKGEKQEISETSSIIKNIYDQSNRP